MKEKIKSFSKGDFSLPPVEVYFSQTHLQIFVGEGEVYKGSLVLSNRYESDVRGLIYPSSFRVEMAETGFEGRHVELAYTYDSRGMSPGDVEQSSFVIICNGGEFEIPFTAIVEKPYFMTAYGKVQNIKNFKKLAVQDFTEAQRMFRSRDFFEILKYEEPRIQHLYKAMRKWSLGERALEEFLVGIKQKEVLFLSLSDTKKVFTKLTDPVSNKLTLTKNTWGFMPFKIIVDGDFIQIDKTSYTTDDFTGMKLELSYVVQPDVLHSGTNYGRLIFETPYERLYYEIEIHMGSNRNEGDNDWEFLIAQELKKFMSCVAGRLDIRQWGTEALESIELLRDHVKQEDILQMGAAHIHFLMDEMDEGAAILEKYNYHRLNIGNDPKLTAYYLFLTTYTHNSVSHVGRVVDEIEKLYLRNPHSWEMLCMLVNISYEYKNYNNRLRVLERQFDNGAKQIIFYLQAYFCIKEKSETLKKLGPFEIQVLNFATKYRLLTKELALYTANLAMQQKAFDLQLFRVLVRAHRQYPDTMILNSICTLLIKGNQANPKYFSWYKKAVDEELKIVQLYEYYMMTVDETKVRYAFPRAIYLYFMHGNILNYKRTALLYANIITYLKEGDEIYDHYREKMRRFTFEQLERRHINESLRILYKRFCGESDLVGNRLQAIHDVCYTYEVQTKVESMRYALVIETNGEIKQRVGLSGGKAKLFLYERDSRIIWEDAEGFHYTESIPHEIKRLFYEPRFVEFCKNNPVVAYKRPDGKMEIEDTFENLKTFGEGHFDEQEIFRICSKRIREDNYEEDDYLTYLCFRLFKKDQYDKVILTYLATYYCGSTKEMKRLWRTARNYNINVYKLSERIITQMVFSEQLFEEEEIFASYYTKGAYFRLKQAYLAFVSREYLVRDRNIDSCIFSIIANEYEAKETMPDICKIACLKFYSTREIEPSVEGMLLSFLRELCEKQIIFPFYMSYKTAWLREVQLYDKFIVGYRARGTGTVTISRKVAKGEGETKNYEPQVLTPMYENIYVKIFVVFADEKVQYYFTETLEDGSTISTDAKSHQIAIEENPVGRYERLNDMIELTPDARKMAMDDFLLEEKMSEKIFKIIR